jgi:hypothetical protein
MSHSDPNRKSVPTVSVQLYFLPSGDFGKLSCHSECPESPIAESLLAF